MKVRIAVVIVIVWSPITFCQNSGIEIGWVENLKKSWDCTDHGIAGFCKNTERGALRSEAESLSLNPQWRPLDNWCEDANGWIKKNNNNYPIIQNSNSISHNNWNTRNSLKISYRFQRKEEILHSIFFIISIHYQILASIIII